MNDGLGPSLLARHADVTRGATPTAGRKRGLAPRSSSAKSFPSYLSTCGSFCLTFGHQASCMTVRSLSQTSSSAHSCSCRHWRQSFNGFHLLCDLVRYPKQLEILACSGGQTDQTLACTLCPGTWKPCYPDSGCCPKPASTSPFSRCRTPRRHRPRAPKPWKLCL